VNSNNRSLPWPLVPTAAGGAYFTDADGRQFLDYHAAFGPIMLGHCHPRVNAAVHESIDRIDLMGAGVTQGEIMLGEAIQELVPSAERVVLANSGSEATYGALRVARAVTGRHKIVKFQGAYHGWHDAVLLNVISRAENVGRPDPLSLGMVAEVVANTLVLPFNDVDALTETMTKEGEQIAAVLVEVIPHNIGCVLPQPEFLAALRDLTSRHGAVLIFDEVITGFRHALGGYQSLVGVVPDLTVFAKAMANGYPIAAIAGRRQLLDRFAPGGGVFHAGTYNGHPAAVAAALATIEELRSGAVHAHTFALGDRLADGMMAIGREFGIPMTVAHFGSVVVPYFYEGRVETYTDLLANDEALDVWFRSTMCDRGIFMLPVALKRNHISAAHTAADIDRTLETARAVLRTAPAKADLAQA
jgi:glutamate-1-semialdehyde 2,1-aminomutase